jgi:hypothetical protein
MDQILQIGGAILILLAFGGAQRGSLTPHSRAYLVLNLVGSAILTAVALIDSDWGFLLLESVWAVVSLWGLIQLGRGRTPRAAH